PDLLLDAERLPQSAGAGGFDQLRVGTAAPQGERQPRRPILGAYAGGARGLHHGGRRRRPLEPEQEVRTDQNRLERQTDTALEIAGLAAALQELDGVLDVLRAVFAAIRLRGEVLDDLRGAGFFVGRRDWAAGKDPAAARRLRH